MLKLEDFKSEDLKQNLETIIGGKGGPAPDCEYLYGSDENNCRTISWDCGETYWTLNNPYMDDLP